MEGTITRSEGFICLDHTRPGAKGSGLEAHCVQAGAPPAAVLLPARMK